MKMKSVFWIFVLLFIVFVLFFNRFWIYKWFNKKESLAEEDVLEIESEKYEKSRVDEEEMLVLVQMLEKLEDVVFLDETLNLEKLAAQLNIQRYYLSQVFSVGLNTSFTKYVNAKRCEFASELLKNRDKTKYSIEDIALKAGFNSTTTFYRAFKENYGVAPSQYS